MNGAYYTTDEQEIYDSNNFRILALKEINHKLLKHSNDREERDFLIEELKRLYGENYSKYCDGKGRNLIHIVAIHRYHKLCQFLIDEGVDAKKLDHNKKSPMHELLYTNQRLCIDTTGKNTKKKIGKCSDLVNDDEKEKIAYIKTFGILLEAGIDLIEKDKFTFSILDIIIYNDHVHFMKEIIKYNQKHGVENLLPSISLKVLLASEEMKNILANERMIAQEDNAPLTHPLLEDARNLSLEDFLKKNFRVANDDETSNSKTPKNETFESLENNSSQLSQLLDSFLNRSPALSLLSINIENFKSQNPQLFK